MSRLVDEKRFELLNYFADAVIVTDAEYTVLFCNQAASKLYGFAPSEVHGRAIAQILNVQPEGLSRQEVRQRLEREGFWRGEALHQTPDGRNIWVEWSLSACKLADGSTGYLGIAHDIVEKKRVESVLKDDERRYRAIFENNRAMKLLIDPESGRILDANSSACEFYGYRHAEITAMTIWQINCLGEEETRKRMRLAATNTQSIFDFQHRLANGERREVQVFSGLADIKGKSVLHSIVLDVTERKHAELALAASEERYRAITEHSHNAICIVAESGKILWGNDKMARLGGYPLEDIYAMESFAALIAPESQDFVLGNFAKFLKGEPYEHHYFFNFLTRDGETRSAEKFVTDYKDQSGQRRLIVNMLDITERLEAERHQRLSGKLLGILNEPLAFKEAMKRILLAINEEMSVSALAIRLKDGDDYPYFADIGFEEEFLKSQNSVLDQGLCKEQDGQTSLVCTCGLVLSGKSDPMLPFFTQGGSFFINDSVSLLDLAPSEDPRFKPRNRCIREGYRSFALIPIRADRTIVGLLQLNERKKNRFTQRIIHSLENLCSIIGVALTRKQSDDALRNSEERLRFAMETSHIGVWDLDLRTHAAFRSQKHDAIFGYDALLPTWSYEQFLDHVLAEDRQQVDEKFQQARKCKGIWNFECRILRKDGEIRWIWAAGLHLQDKDGAFSRIAGIVQDITERKLDDEEKAKLQEQLQQAMKMEAVGRLAGGVAHDFNNLLTGITGHISLALMDLSPDDPLVEPLTEVTKAADSAASLTRQLLAFSRKQIIEPRVLNLNEILSSLHKMLRRLIGENIELSTLPAAELGAVLVDPGQFEQILVNLAVNAKDAMPDGGKLMIETENVTLTQEDCERLDYDYPGPHVRLSVSDTGQGMNDEVKLHLFEPFFTTKPRGRGTGLGLATIYGTVKQAGGCIEVQSEEGRGTTFTIYLPRIQAKVQTLGRDGRAPSMIGGTETILLVEDETIVRDLAARILKRLGYTTLQAQSGEQALALAEDMRERIDLLMTDVVMPGMNGRQLAEKLLVIHPEAKVLYTSGYTDDVIVHHGVLDKSLNFIAKPYSPQALAQKLRNVLSGEAPFADAKR